MLSELCIIFWCPSGKAEMSFSSLKWLHSHPSGWRLGNRYFHFTQFQRFCDCFSTLSIFSKCYSFLCGPLLIGSGMFSTKNCLCISCVKMCPLETMLSEFPVFIVLTFNLILFSHHLFFIFCKPNGEKTYSFVIFKPLPKHWRQALLPWLNFRVLSRLFHTHFFLLDAQPPCQKNSRTKCHCLLRTVYSMFRLLKFMCALTCHFRLADFVSKYIYLLFLADKLPTCFSLRCPSNCRNELATMFFRRAKYVICDSKCWIVVFTPAGYM